MAKAGPGRQTQATVGAASKWQADGRNTRLAHGTVLDDGAAPHTASGS